MSQGKRLRDINHLKMKNPPYAVKGEKKACSTLEVGKNKPFFRQVRMYAEYWKRAARHL